MTPGDQKSFSQSYSLFHEEDSTRRPAALMFHGLSGSIEELKELADLLYSKNFDVHLPLLTGHGTDIEELRRIPASVWLADAERALSEIQQRNPSALFLVGLSFGSLLAVHLAGKHPDAFTGLVLFSVPLSIRARGKHRLLAALSYLPNALLNPLGIVPKKKRPHVTFSGTRVAYDSHSIASLARLEYIRRSAFRLAGKISCPVLALQDPNDHHLDGAGMNILRRKLHHAQLTTEWILGGEHELTIGPQQQQVFEKILHFTQSALHQS